MRNSWGFHGQDGWTIGPSVDHYRLLKCYIPEANSEIDCNTINFFPHHYPMPEYKLEEYLKQATENIIHILLSKKSRTLTFNTRDDTYTALHQLATILNKTTEYPNTDIIYPPAKYTVNTSSPTQVPRVEANTYVQAPRVDNSAPLSLPRVHAFSNTAPIIPPFMPSKKTYPFQHISITLQY